MPTLTEEITVGEVLIWLRKLEKLKSDATKVVMVKQLLTRQLSLIQSTVKGCVREKIDIDNRDKLHLYEGDDGQYWYDKGINDTIDTITSNLQKAGLL